MRRDIISIVNRLSKEDGTLDFPVLEAYEFIFEYCKANKIHPGKVKFSMKNGCLYDSSKLLTRLVPRPAFACWNGNGPDYEDMILARQEACYD